MQAPVKSEPLVKKTIKKDVNITKIVKTPIVVKKTKIVSAPTISAKQQYLKVNFSKIASAINDAKFYPKKARKLHIEGTVKIKFLLKHDKTVKILDVSCNKRFLKKAAIKIIQKASTEFPPPPKDIEINIPIEFRLKN
ncbi:MAG: TonB family protein [Epsilonproteobacteria bacterium]|nr:TonB family protein [Campylobacterota bacterium]